MKLKLFSIPFLALIFILFPMLTPDETGSMGILVWGSLLFLAILLTVSKSNRLPNWTAFAILMWLSGVISTVFSSYSDPGNDVLKYLAFVLLLIFLSNYKYEEIYFQITFLIYTILALILSILIILSFLYGFVHVDSIYEGNIRYSIGITGIYKNPNYVASFIVLSVLTLLFLLVNKKLKMRYKVITLTCAIIMIVSVFLTGTRAAIISVILSVLSFFIYYSKNHKNIILRALPFVLLIFATVFYYDRIVEIVELIGSERGGFTEDVRTESWLHALKIIGNSPLFGYGINSWNSFRGNDYLGGLHNVFLEYFLNQGLIGLVFLMFTMFVGWSKVKKTDRFIVFSFCLINTFPLFFQNGLIDITFWRVLLMNRIIIDYSSYSELGVNHLISSAVK